MKDTIAEQTFVFFWGGVAREVTVTHQFFTRLCNYN